MYSTKILKFLLFFGGIIILSIGCYMKTNEITSTGSPYSNRFGVVMQPGTIDGNGTIQLGLFLLICSLIAYFIYNSEKKKREKAKFEEDKDVKIKKAKPINFYKNPTKHKL